MKKRRNVKIWKLLQKISSDLIGSNCYYYSHSNHNQIMIPQSKAPRVCIIGGGPAGLASLRFISSISQNVVLFEAKE